MLTLETLQRTTAVRRRPDVRVGSASRRDRSCPSRVGVPCRRMAAVEFHRPPGLCCESGAFLQLNNARQACDGVLDAIPARLDKLNNAQISLPPRIYVWYFLTDLRVRGPPPHSLAWPSRPGDWPPVPDVV